MDKFSEAVRILDIDLKHMNLMATRTSKKKEQEIDSLTINNLLSIRRT